MSWLKSIFPAKTPTSGVSITPHEQRNGLPVYEPKIRGEKLERRDIFVTQNNTQTKISIDVLRAQFRSGKILGELPVLVTNYYCEQTYYCGEGTVADIVNAWETAPIEYVDQEDVNRMISDYSLQGYQIHTKADYHDFKKLFAQCAACYGYILTHSKEFKRVSKTEVKDLVLLLNAEDPTWDSPDGIKRFAAEVRSRYPETIRSESEKKLKKTRDKAKKLKYEEKYLAVKIRNMLTDFPHKEMLVEIKDVGTVAIREFKEHLRNGAITPETFVRYRAESAWMELHDFLQDWLKTKGTINQIRYLTFLQKQHKILRGIPLDISREEISERITELAPYQE